jgi:hypothetical protein
MSFAVLKMTRETIRKRQVAAVPNRAVINFFEICGVAVRF